MAKKSKHEDEHHHPELIAPPQKSIKIPPGSKPPAGVLASLSKMWISETGKKSKSGWKIVYKQGFQRGFTAAASVRVMRKEAKTTHAWHVPNANVPPPRDAVPIPNYVRGMMTKYYVDGYLAGWANSNNPKPKSKSKATSHHK